MKINLHKIVVGGLISAFIIGMIIAHKIEKEEDNVKLKYIKNDLFNYILDKKLCERCTISDNLRKKLLKIVDRIEKARNEYELEVIHTDIDVLEANIALMEFTIIK